MNQEYGKKIENLVAIMKQLRSPEGCPWDREQTHASLKRCLMEECGELMDAIDEIMEPLYPGYRRAFAISEVTGTWKPMKGSHPYKGRPGKIETAKEHKIEFIVKESDLKKVLLKIREIHPYEEPAIDVLPTYSWKSMI